MSVLMGTWFGLPTEEPRRSAGGAERGTSCGFSAFLRQWTDDPSPARSYALAAIAGVTLAAGAVVAAGAPIVSPQIPALRWEERSDWINVKTDIAPAAMGDGQADDTLAVQRALAGVRDGSVLYFAPGTYRITAPLVLKNSTGARWIGGLIVGSGRDTKWVWDGADGGTMLVLNGMAYSRFIGFELDGRGKAGVGFHYQATQGFQTTTVSS